MRPSIEHGWDGADTIKWYVWYAMVWYGMVCYAMLCYGKPGNSYAWRREEIPDLKWGIWDHWERRIQQRREWGRDQT